MAHHSAREKFGWNEPSSLFGVHPTAIGSKEATDASNGTTYATGSCGSGSGVCYAPPGEIISATIDVTSSFGGINLTNTYNNRLQPLELKASSTGGAAFDLTYSFVDPVTAGNAGHVYATTNNLNNNRSQVFTYDPLNRIISAGTTVTSSSSCWGYLYTYDIWGNLLSQAGNSTSYSGCSEPITSAVSATTQNQISAFTYDSAGNTVNDGLYFYIFDGQGQMISAAGVDYSYDGDGRRVSKVGSKLYWYGPGGEILAETDAYGNTLNEYVFFGSERVAMLPGGNVNNAQFYVQDFLGSTRVVTTNNGVVCYDADFAPYGAEFAALNSCTQNDYKFEGKERDAESSNDAFGARYYSNRFGRWLSSDWSAVPVAVPYADLVNPQTLNLYAMVHDDPETFADLDGHAWWWGRGCDQYGDNCSPEAFAAVQAAQAQRSQNTSCLTAGAQGPCQAQNQQSNRQDDGSYKATPAQLAKIQEAADKKKTIGNGECVTACERFTGVPGPTSKWQGGKPATELTDNDKGTAIATFIKGSDGKWHYLPDSGGHKNSGTFMGTSTKGTFWMADQWPNGQKPVSIWNVGSSVGSNPNNASMDPASYRVIIVPNP